MSMTAPSLLLYNDINNDYDLQIRNRRETTDRMAKQAPPVLEFTIIATSRKNNFYRPFRFSITRMAPSSESGKRPLINRSRYERT